MVQRERERQRERDRERERDTYIYEAISSNFCSVEDFLR